MRNKSKINTRILLTISLAILFLGLFYVSHGHALQLKSTLRPNQEYQKNNPIPERFFSKGINPADLGSYQSNGIENIGGFGWIEEEIIGDNLFINDLDVAVDGQNNTHVFWSAKEGSDWNIYYRVKDYLTGNWSAKTFFAETVGENYGVLDLVADLLGRLHIVYITPSRVEYSCFTTSWSFPDYFYIYSPGKPQIRVDSNNNPVFMVSISSNNVDYYVDLFAYNATTSNWMEQVLDFFGFQYSRQATSFDFTIINRNGVDKVFIVYSATQKEWATDNYYASIHGFISEEGIISDLIQDSLLIEYELPGIFYGSFKPNIVQTDTNHLSVIYPIPDSAYDYSVYETKRVGTGSWATPVKLSSKAGYSTNINSDIDSNNRIITTWRDEFILNGTSVSRVYMKIFSSESHTWSSDFKISNETHLDNYQTFAFDKQGNLNFVWFRRNDTHRELVFRQAWGDVDEDGLFTKDELEIYGTDPFDPDCDNDGLKDGLEVTADPPLDPFDPDYDNDTMLDGYEYHNGLDPYTNDTAGDLDNDGLINLEEYLIGSSSNTNDTDNDNIGDYEEVKVYKTSPIDDDSDGDTLDDYLEIIILGSNASNTDTDSDGMDDRWEYLYSVVNGSIPGLNLLLDDSAADLDGDGLTNLQEYQFNTGPHLADTENDGLNDYLEVLVYGTDPWDLDTDDDGLRDGPEVHTHGTNPLLWDTDTDGVNDKIEINNGMNATFWDSDGDQMSDGYEWQYGLNPLLDLDAHFDNDSDGLQNIIEYQYLSNPFNVDTDGDLLTDDVEALIGSSLTLVDTDSDGLDDLYEYSVSHTSLLEQDTDKDGLDDYSEIFVFGIDPNKIDTDNDGINDGKEVYVYFTNPSRSDSDYDHLDDLLEILLNTNPNKKDTDNDGMDDHFEWFYHLNPLLDDSELDKDGDGVSNSEEYYYLSNPEKIDTDNDGLSDYCEIYQYFTKPNHPDTDLDGLSDYDETQIYFTSPLDPDEDDDRLLDGEEILVGTNPHNPDTDGDGIFDGQEIEDGTDPLNPNENTIKTIRNLVIIIYSSASLFMLIYYLGPMLYSRIKRREEHLWFQEGSKFRQEKAEKFIESSHQETFLKKNDIKRKD